MLNASSETVPVDVVCSVVFVYRMIGPYPTLNDTSDSCFCGVVDNMIPAAFASIPSSANAASIDPHKSSEALGIFTRLNTDAISTILINLLDDIYWL